MFSQETISKALELRSKNGLEATEAALISDLEKSGTKYTETATPRYRTAGDSPIFIAGKYLTKHGICPATGEKDTHERKAPARRAASAAASSAASAEISEEALIRVLAGKGFKFVRLVNSLTGQVVEEQKDPQIEKLGLVCAPIPKNSDGTIYVTQTSPQVQVSLSLDKFLEIAGIKP